MYTYEIDHQLTLINGNHSEKPLIKLCTYEEWNQSLNQTESKPALTKGYDSIHFCKIESYPSYILGTLSIPVKHNFKESKKVFFYIEKGQIIFIDDSHFIQNILKALSASKFWENPCLECFLTDFLKEIIVNDLIYAEELENHISKLESAAINGTVNHFNHKMMVFRKELLSFYYYYSQLIDLAELLIENENEFFKPDPLKLLNTFIRRVERLRDNTLMLREYATQVREEYQAQIDIKQNNTMRILTVVTSIFLPLTLIVGWYGMNFTGMPELNWKYGYPFVIILSIITILLCILICKKKKFL